MTAQAGFGSFGEYLNAVKDASIPGGRRDGRLQIVNTPSTGANESSGGDGGFAVPGKWTEEILRPLKAPTSILSRLRVVSDAAQVYLPIDVERPWSTKGPRPYWLSEGTQATQSKPAIQGRTLRADKLVVLLPVTDELWADSVGLAAYVSSAAGERIGYTLVNQVLWGTANGAPGAGVVASGGTLTVTRHSGGTFALLDAMGMLSALDAACRPNAVWLMNPDVESLARAFGWPYYAFAGQSGFSYPTLLGMPVLLTEACAALGSVGDILLFDPSQYLVTSRFQETWSLHFQFDYDQATYRAVIRWAGMPAYSATFARPNSTNPSAAYTVLST